MKRKILTFSLLAVAGCSISAQENGVFNHIGFGVGLGTTGITIDLAAPVSPYVEIRTGVDYMPKIKYNTALKISVNTTDKEKAQKYTGVTIPDKVDVQGTNSMTTGHLLIDVFPFRSSSFHITAGGYFGNSKIINVYNKKDQDLKTIIDYNELAMKNPLLELKTVCVQLGDYSLTPCKTPEGGHVDSNIKVCDFRPYIGMGFGRSVPQKHRLACQCDLGIQFWKTPKVYLTGTDGETQLTEESVGEKYGGIIKTLSRITVYPCLSIRLMGRIF